jgi:hypothetical protein
MKAIHLIRTFLLLVVVATISVRCSCEDPKPGTATPTQNLSRTWKVQSGTIAGVAIPATSLAAFRITFTSTLTYSIVRGSAPVSPSKAPTQTGAWALAGSTITLDGGTANARALNFANLTDKTLTISWKEDSDKNNPEVVFNLITE